MGGLCWNKVSLPLREGQEHLNSSARPALLGVQVPPLAARRWLPPCCEQRLVQALAGPLIDFASAPQMVRTPGGRPGGAGCSLALPRLSLEGSPTAAGCAQTRLCLQGLKTWLFYLDLSPGTSKRLTGKTPPPPPLPVPSPISNAPSVTQVPRGPDGEERCLSHTE